MDIVPSLLKAGKRVVVLAADYRLKNTSVYNAAYGTPHKDKDGLKRAVYGLPEIYRPKIRNALLVANPGCSPTASILGLAPLVALSDFSSIVIDAKSGTTGAGKKAVQEMLFSEVDEDFRAYKVNTHQHMPEIGQELTRLAGKKTQIVFVPHLLPLKRGILATIYVTVPGKKAGLANLYRKFYKNEPFVRIREEGAFPSIKDVAGIHVQGGAEGGPMGAFAPLIGEILGVKFVPITFTADGKRRSLTIPGIMQMAVQGVSSMKPDGSVTTLDFGHPFAQGGGPLAQAAGEQGSTWSDYGMRFDNAGKNGHYAAISWSGG
jgi:hypothetical protein